MNEELTILNELESFSIERLSQMRYIINNIINERMRNDIRTLNDEHLKKFIIDDVIIVEYSDEYRIYHILSDPYIDITDIDYKASVKARIFHISKENDYSMCYFDDFIDVSTIVEQEYRKMNISGNYLKAMFDDRIDELDRIDQRYFERVLETIRTDE